MLKRKEGGREGEIRREKSRLRGGAAGGEKRGMDQEIQQTIRTGNETNYTPEKCHRPPYS